MAGAFYRFLAGAFDRFLTGAFDQAELARLFDRRFFYRLLTGAFFTGAFDRFSAGAFLTGAFSLAISTGDFDRPLF